MRIIKSFLFLLCLTSFITACDREERPPQTFPEQTPTEKEAAAAIKEAPVSEKTPIIFMEEDILLQRGETLSDALPDWRPFRKQKPTLLLLSNNPALVPPPAQLSEQITQAMTSSSDAELRVDGNPQLANPLFLPGMTVDLALRHDWFQKFIWAIPIQDPEKQLSLEKFKIQFTERGMAVEADLKTLELKDNVFSGQQRGTPFIAAALENLPQPEGPLIIHIDLSYFQQLYKNEIVTPAMPMVANVLQQLKERKLPVLAVTFSYSHNEGGIPLDVRFLGDFLKYLIEKPERLDQEVPPAWRAQNDILYLNNFFQRDKIEELHLTQANAAPDSAWVRYNLYNLANRNNDPETAFKHLEGAINIDPVYATEFIKLAHLDKEEIPAVHKLAMIKLASTAMPDNVNLKLKQAELALAADDKILAEATLNELKGQTWSPVYYRGMQEYLDSLGSKLN